MAPRRQWAGMLAVPPAAGGSVTAAVAAAVIAGAAFLAPRAGAAAVFGVQAPRGSMAGGTYLTVWGSGFNRDGREGETRV
jgi:hypothetical protein